MLERFADQQNGGFYFTASDHERLIQRPKPIHDDALPSGNGIAAQVLLKLGHLVGRLDYLDAAERTLCWAAPTVVQIPTACNALLTALQEWLEPATIIVLRGDTAALPEWQDRCAMPYAPRRLTLAIPADAVLPTGLLAERRAGPAPVTAYLCQAIQCLAPMTNLVDLGRAID